jgi:hypothetical protein
MMHLLEKVAIGDPKNDPFFARLQQRERAMAEARGLKYSPGMRMAPKNFWQQELPFPGTHQPHPALEKEIIKQTGPGLKTKLRHYTVGRLKRIWGQPGPHKMWRRAGLIGGAAGLGLLGKGWYDANQNEKQLKALQEELNSAGPKTGAQVDYVPAAPTTPKPVGFPVVPQPLETNSNVLNTGKKKNSLQENKIMRPTDKTATALLSKIAFLDSGVWPLIAGTGGGVGGYYLGKKVIDPLLTSRQNKIREQIARGEQWIGRMDKAKRLAPIAGATVGAILLATLAAKSAKRQERERMAQVQAAGGPGQYGFDPGERYTSSNPEAAYY